MPSGLSGLTELMRGINGEIIYLSECIVALEETLTLFMRPNDSESPEATIPSDLSPHEEQLYHNLLSIQAMAERVVTIRNRIVI